MKAQPFTIRKNTYGQRFVVIGEKVIPADIAGLCAGPDVWISQIECKCRDCGKKFPLRELQNGGQWCEECQAASIA